jgi:hypothetical protein
MIKIRVEINEEKRNGEKNQSKRHLLKASAKWICL